jgi:Ca-activated chloride channel family protein
MNSPSSCSGSLVISFLASFLALSSIHAQSVISPANFRTNAQLVLVPVTVTDHNGKTIQGLRADNFRILDDQTPQQIVSFSGEDAPCSVGLILDISGSMRDTLSVAKEVAQSVFRAANSDDEFLLLTVSTQPEAISGFTTDVASLEKSIQFTKPGGFTALIDTVRLGLSRMRDGKRPRRALLILSDGMDNHSRYSKGELMRVALEADVQIYTIILDNPSSGNTIPFRPSLIAKPWDHPEQRQGRSLLEDLSDKTGGLHFHVRDVAEAKEAANKAGRALRNEYVIGYQPPDPNGSGKWHRIRVKADVPSTSVYARNGYYSR